MNLVCSVAEWRALPFFSSYSMGLNFAVVLCTHLHQPCLTMQLLCPQIHGLTSEVLNSWQQKASRVRAVQQMLAQLYQACFTRTVHMLTTLNDSISSVHELV